MSGDLGQIEDGGALTNCQCDTACPLPPGPATAVSACRVSNAKVQLDDGGVGWDVTCVYFISTVGRMPEGLKAPATALPSTVSEYLALSGHLEAASVGAFRRVARELRKWNAPAHLVARARCAARDEIRHARITRRAARRLGGAALAVELEPQRDRELEAFAIENATEGCVRETWGAVLALWQRSRAPHPDIRRVADAIAEDESRHAELAWDIHAWVMDRLTPDARDRVRDAREEAISSLWQGAENSRLADVLPTRAEAAALLRGLQEHVWAKAPQQSLATLGRGGRPTR